jgi:aconitate hydratase
MSKLNSYKTLSTLDAGGKKYQYHSFKKLEAATGKSLKRLPYSIKILLENMLRCEDDKAVKKADIDAVMNWNAKAEPDYEIQFMPARVVLQDFTGVPCVADLAAMRGAVKRLGGDPSKINPLQPVDLVIDHSVQIDEFGSDRAVTANSQLEFERNSERYEFLKWAQKAFRNFRAVPPATGIVHQVNLEYLAPVAFVRNDEKEEWIYPDTCIGTDSHTPMVNGLGVVGWGVGGIEAEAAMLGQPCSMLIPQVVGFKLSGSLPAGTTATDLVLTVVQMLRKKGVVGKFVEFFGPGYASLGVADRATISNMAPEYGATIGIFPVDDRTLEYLELTGRGHMKDRVAAYYKEQGLWFDPNNTPEFTDVLELDLGTVQPSLAGPARPQDRVLLGDVRKSFRNYLTTWAKDKLGTASESDVKGWVADGGSVALSGIQNPPEWMDEHPDKKWGFLGQCVPVRQPGGQSYNLTHGSVVIASITSCTNTSNPSVLIAAGLLARNAVRRGLSVKPWVKTSFAPGSKVVTEYMLESGLLSYMEGLKFHIVGYGCTTCIGNSGPLPPHIEKAIVDGNLATSSVLSGNRNFEARVHPLVRTNYLASPPLVVAYALAGNVNVDLSKDPLAYDPNGHAVYLKDIWPSQKEVDEVIAKCVTTRQFNKVYSDVFAGSQEWQNVKVKEGQIYEWDPKSTYIKEPPFFEGFGPNPAPLKDIQAARCLVYVGDSVTTDHISPAGNIGKSSVAGQFLQSIGVQQRDFNSFGARRGNHEVMMRGTFANVRIKNMLLPGVEGPFTKYLPDGVQMPIFDAAMKYKDAGIPSIVLAGKEYGSGSSRDWAAKGPALQGVRAAIAESFERIHRSNLVGMGILPLQFKDGESAKSLGLTGEETFDIAGLAALQPGQTVDVVAKSADGKSKTFQARVRIDTPNEVEYFRNGGILPYVLRQILKTN